MFVCGLSSHCVSVRLCVAYVAIVCGYARMWAMHPLFVSVGRLAIVCEHVCVWAISPLCVGMLVCGLFSHCVRMFSYMGYLAIVCDWFRLWEIWPSCVSMFVGYSSI